MTALPNRATDSARGWRYVIGCALTFAALVAVLVTGLAFTAHGEPTVAWSRSAQYIHFWREKQRRIAARTGSPRVLLAGGSGVLYSVRADRLTVAVGRPVINIGLHAGLGLDYLLYDIERFVRPGDVVVLVLEYQMLGTTEPHWTLADYAIPSDPDYLATIGPARTYALSKLLTPREYWRKTFARFYARADPTPFFAMMDDYGDLIANKRSEIKPYHHKALERFREPRGGKLDGGSIALLRAFIARCRAKGATVVAGFPAFLHFPEYDSGRHAAFFESVVKLYEREGVPVLGKPSASFFPRESFFDSNYHLHDEAAAVFTARLAPRLSRVLACLDHGKGAAACVDPSMSVDFARPGTPLGVEVLSGFSVAEPWGRWTDGVRANIRFAEPLPRRFRLDLAVERVFHPTGALEIEVDLGQDRRRVVARRGQELSIEFDNPAGLADIGLTLPDGGSPYSLGLSSDRRRLGVGLSRMRVTPLD